MKILLNVLLASISIMMLGCISAAPNRHSEEIAVFKAGYANLVTFRRVKLADDPSKYPPHSERYLDFLAADSASLSAIDYWRDEAKALRAKLPRKERENLVKELLIVAKDDGVMREMSDELR